MAEISIASVLFPRLFRVFTVVTVCSNFLTVYIRFLWFFVFFDFDEDSVNFKRETMKQWDGHDYPGWVEAWCDRNPDANRSLLGFTAWHLRENKIARRQSNSRAMMA